MCWELERTSTPKARKEYPCEALDAINSSGYRKADFAPEDWATIEAARASGGRIAKGDRYLLTEGKWEGEFTNFRARIDLHEICIKYGLYGDC